MKSTSEIREQKLAMIRRWESSGIKQKPFCEQENIPTHHFHYWLKKYRKVKRASPHTGNFIKLATPVKESKGSMYAEMIFKNGNCIRFYGPVSALELKQLAH